MVAELDRASSPAKGKGKTGPSAGRPASASGSQAGKGAGKPSEGKPAKGAGKPAEGKPAKGAGKAKGKPAEAGKSGTCSLTGGPSQKKGGRSEAKHAQREQRGADRRERQGTDPVVLRENPDAPPGIPEPKTPPADSPVNDQGGPKSPSSQSKPPSSQAQCLVKSHLTSEEKTAKRSGEPRPLLPQLLPPVGLRHAVRNRPGHPWE
eukprot:s7937_g1.t1